MEIRVRVFGFQDLAFKGLGFTALNEVLLRCGISGYLKLLYGPKWSTLPGTNMETPKKDKRACWVSMLVWGSVGHMSYSLNS